MSLRRHPKPSPIPTPTNDVTPLAVPKTRNLTLALSVLFGFSALYFCLIYIVFLINYELRRQIAIHYVTSLVGFFLLVCWLIPIGPRMISVAARLVGSPKKDLFGYDINKKGTSGGSVRVAESLGVVVGAVYLGICIADLPFIFTTGVGLLEQYIVGQFVITISLIIGFIDDALNLRWRTKMVLPIIYAVILLRVYSGGTTIIIPKPLVQYVGKTAYDLGWMYLVYMGMLVVFCPNAINILAGLNGLEVGQSIVISAFILILNVMKIYEATDSEYELNHILSIFIVLPFFVVSCALLTFNWYPASVFVGDSYTFFAGTTLAVAGILGHFSETLLIFFLPQVLNFLYSCPQLFKIIPCPVHRLPRFDPKTGLLTASQDMNLVNLFLRLFGPCSEKALTIRLIIFQIMSGLLGIWLNVVLPGWYK